MDYEFWFWMLISFILGRGTIRPYFYIGDDIEKYENAWIGIYFKRH